MPDFEVCRPKFAEEGIVTGKQMCDAILKECQVAVTMPHEMMIVRHEWFFKLLAFAGLGFFEADRRVHREVVLRRLRRIPSLGLGDGHPRNGDGRRICEGACSKSGRRHSEAEGFRR